MGAICFFLNFFRVYNIFVDERTDTESKTILVCISPAPASARVVQVAADMARNAGAEMCAVYVDASTGLGLSPADQRRLRQHFALVRRLGGEIVTINGHSIAKEIVDYAQRHRIKSIVIGKNASQDGFRRRRGSRRRDTVSAILQRGRYLDIHVIPGNPVDYPQPRELSEEPGRVRSAGRLSLSAARAILILAAAVGFGHLFFRTGFTEANTVMIFILAVVLISTFEGRILGLAASAAAVVLFNFMFTEPRYTLVVYDRQYLITFPVMLAVALLTSELTARIKREARTAQLRERRTAMLYRTTRSLLQARGDRDVAREVVRHLNALLHRETTCFLRENNGSWTRIESEENDRLRHDEASTEYSSTEMEAVQWVYDNATPAGCSTSNVPNAGRYYEPLVVQERALGVVGVTCDDGTLDPSHQSLLEVVAAQLAIALDRERLARAEEESKIAMERERLRSNLLRSISHDLRTPLASITGASSILLSENRLEENSRMQLLRDIHDDATWLTSLVENLLSLTRLDAEALKLRSEWEVVEDVLLSAAERCRKRTSPDRIVVSLPSEPLVTQMDAGLIEQVVVNIIDNAIRYSPDDGKIYIGVTKIDSILRFVIRDEGPGLSPQALLHAFDRFYTETGGPDARRGLGLGLSICKSIIAAHGGEIGVKNGATGGAIFYFTLPFTPPPATLLREDTEREITN